MITAMPRIAIAVEDFEAAVSTFRDGFGLPVVDFSDRTVPDLGAHVGMCVPPGGSNIELMSPSDDRPLGQSLQRFLDRRGEGLYALMLEAPDPDAEAVELTDRGLDVLPLMPGAGGRDVHPRSTHGVLIRVYPDDSVGKLTPPRADDPHLSGIVRAIVATKDAVAAAETYGRGFGLSVEPGVDDAERGVVTARCHPPKGGVIEFVSAADTRRAFAADVQRAVDERGEGLHTLVLEAADRDAALATLAARGFAPDGGALTVFGTRFLIS